jgi:quercetin dioxygenase-like cupin family protein
MASTGQELRNPVTAQTLVFRRTSADTGGELLEMESIWEQPGPEPPAHFHPSQEERFELLEGTLQVEIGGERRTLSRGDRLVVPPSTVHAMWNEGPERARASWVTTPALRTEQFFERAWGLAAGTVDARLGETLLDDFSDEFRLAPSGE